jgi:NitT/TauT family transport system substrate-binding protein
MEDRTLNRADALYVALTGLAFAALPREVDAADVATIRIGGGSNDNMGEPYYARDGGFTKRHELDAQITELGSGGALTAAVAAGALDVTITNIASIAAAHIRRLPVTVIAGGALYSADAPPSTALLVLKESTIHEPADLSGKTIALSTLRDLQQAAIMAWLEKHGVVPTSVSFVELPNGAQLEALKSKRIDATMTSTPWMNASLADARILATPYEVLGRRLLLTAWIANNTWLASNKAVAAKLVTAIKETAQWANRNRPATAAILERISKVTPATIASMTRLEFADRLDPQLIQPIIDASARYGFLPQTFPASTLLSAG